MTSDAALAHLPDTDGFTVSRALAGLAGLVDLYLVHWPQGDQELIKVGRSIAQEKLE